MDFLLTTLLYLVIAAVAVTGGWLLARSRGQQNIIELQNSLKAYAEEEKRLREELATQRAQTAEQSQQLAVSREQAKNLQQQLQNQQQMREQFKSLAAEALGENSGRLVKSSRESLAEVIKPVREQLKDFVGKAEMMYNNEDKQRSVLAEQVKLLTETNKLIGEEAHNLTRALKGDSRVRGEWGEMVLDRLLEEAGLAEGRDYSRQDSQSNEEGNRLRPDIIIQLPGERQVVIDSKVSLIHWERYVSTEDKGEEQQYFSEHCRSVREHLKGLAKKNYQQLPGIQSLDLVLLFVPVEGALLAALQGDPTLYNDAWERRIAVVGPSTLFAVLRIIENLWRLDKQNRHARDISRLAQRIEKKFSGLTESLEKAGRALEMARERYDDVRRKFIDGRGSLQSQVQKMSQFEFPEESQKSVLESRQNETRNSDTVD